MLITFFDIKGIVALNSFHKVNQPSLYEEIMMQLHETVHRKRPELWFSDWILHHDSAPAHKVLSVKQ
jgi:hypothetical protein